MENNFRFGEYLKRKRKEKGFTIRNLALKSGISKSYISMLERGVKKYPSAQVLNKLAKPLGVTEQELFKIIGYMGEHNVEKQEDSKGAITTSDKNNHIINEEANVFFFDLDGLSETDIQQIKDHIEFLKHRAKDKNKGNE